MGRHRGRPVEELSRDVFDLLVIGGGIVAGPGLLSTRRGQGFVWHWWTPGTLVGRHPGLQRAWFTVGFATLERAIFGSCAWP